MLLFIFAAGLDVRISDLGHGGPGTNPLEWVMFSALLILMADSIVAPRQWHAISTFAWRNNRFLVLYGWWTMLAGVVGVLQLPLSFFVFRNMLPSLMFFYFLCHTVRTGEQGIRVFITLLYAAIPNAVLAISQLVFKKPFPVPMNAASLVKMDVDGSVVTAAVSGLFNHPNALAVFMLPVFLSAFGLSICRARIGWFYRTGSILMTLIVAALLYETRAKGAWAWGLFGVMILLIPTRLFASRASFWGILLALLSLVAALTAYSLYKGGALSTMMTRVLLWNTAFHVLLTEPFVAIFGSGQEFMWAASVTGSDLQYPNAHNVFLNQAVYFGIPGFILYVCFFTHALFNGCRSFRASVVREERACLKIAVCVLASLAGCIFFEPAAESSGLALECFLLVGMAGMFRPGRVSNDVK